MGHNVRFASFGIDASPSTPSPLVAARPTLSDCKLGICRTAINIASARIASFLKSSDPNKPPLPVQREIRNGRQVLQIAKDRHIGRLQLRAAGNRKSRATAPPTAGGWRWRETPRPCSENLRESRAQRPNWREGDQSRPADGRANRQGQVSQLLQAGQMGQTGVGESSVVDTEFLQTIERPDCFPGRRRRSVAVLKRAPHDRERFWRARPALPTGDSLPRSAEVSVSCPGGGSAAPRLNGRPAAALGHHAFRAWSETPFKLSFSRRGSVSPAKSSVVKTDRSIVSERKSGS